MLWMDQARRYLADPQSAPVAPFFDAVGYPDLADDDLAYGTAIVGLCLHNAGVVPPKTLTAKAYLAFGTPIAKPRPGAVAVIQVDEAAYRAAFVHSVQGDEVMLIGGHAAGKVAIDLVAASKIAGLRWPAVSLGSNWLTQPGAPKLEVQKPKEPTVKQEAPQEPTPAAAPPVEEEWTPDTPAEDAPEEVPQETPPRVDAELPPPSFGWSMSDLLHRASDGQDAFPRPPPVGDENPRPLFTGEPFEMDAYPDDDPRPYTEPELPPEQPERPSRPLLKLHDQAWERFCAIFEHKCVSAQNDQMRYEAAMQARNGSAYAMGLLEGEAAARGVTTIALANQIVAERHTAEAKVMGWHVVKANLELALSVAEDSQVDGLIEEALSQL